MRDPGHLSPIIRLIHCGWFTSSRTGSRQSGSSAARTPLLVAVVAVLIVVSAIGLPAPASAAVAAERTPQPRAGWRWPVVGSPTIIRPFDPPGRPWGSGHRGVDLAATTGIAVMAAADGVVGFAGRIAGRGVVTVVHGDLRTTYEPVAASVSVGQRLVAGDTLGIIEAVGSHCAPESCLHWGLRRGADYLNPLALVRAGPSRLLPLWSARRAPRPPPIGNRLTQLPTGPLPEFAAPSGAVPARQLLAVGTAATVGRLLGATRLKAP